MNGLLKFLLKVGIVAAILVAAQFLCSLSDDCRLVAKVFCPSLVQLGFWVIIMAVLLYGGMALLALPFALTSGLVDQVRQRRIQKRVQQQNEAKESGQGQT